MEYCSSQQAQLFLYTSTTTLLCLPSIVVSIFIEIASIFNNFSSTDVQYDYVLTCLIVGSIISFVAHFLIVAGVYEVSLVYFLETCKDNICFQKNPYYLLPYLIESAVLAIFWSGLICVLIHYRKDSDQKLVADSCFIGFYGEYVKVCVMIFIKDMFLQKQSSNYIC